MTDETITQAWQFWSQPLDNLLEVVHGTPAGLDRTDGE
jgi:hypothetical protein